jgi:hypothetical protein
MDTEMMLRIGAVAVGVLILLGSWIDVRSIVGRLLTMLTTSKPKTPPMPVAPVANEDEQFLHIIDLWYQLRSECEDYGLPKALVAIDKVFPLLNDKIEDNQ